MAEDFVKDPPPAPAHLQLTLLNVPPALGATASLPRPQHVVLNHVYCQRSTHQVNPQCSLSTELLSVYTKARFEGYSSS